MTQQRGPWGLPHWTVSHSFVRTFFSNTLKSWSSDTMHRQPNLFSPTRCVFELHRDENHASQCEFVEVVAVHRAQTRLVLANQLHKLVLFIS